MSFLEPPRPDRRPVQRARRALEHAVWLASPLWRPPDRLARSPVTTYVRPDRPRDLHFRPHSLGDVEVVTQIFVNADYDVSPWLQGRRLTDLAAHMAERGVTPLVIDAGANIGASAVYFHEVFGARVVCVEPQAENCELLRRNVEGCDAVVIEAALAGAEGETTLVDTGAGDHSFMTVDSPGSPAGRRVPTTTMARLLEEHAGERCRPLIAKLDIEGAEAGVFSADASWMDAFPCVAIELHDWLLPGEGTSRPFLSAVAHAQRDILQRGENLFSFDLALIDGLEETLAEAEVTASLRGW